MEIQTIKEIRDIETKELQGYLVNGMNVPLADGNRHYQEVQEYIANGGVVEPAFTEEELVQQEQSLFRAERDNLLKEADIEIYKLEDTAQDATAWRAYRQALRDATGTWVMPSKPL